MYLILMHKIIEIQNYYFICNYSQFFYNPQLICHSVVYIFTILFLNLCKSYGLLSLFGLMGISNVNN